MSNLTGNYKISLGEVQGVDVIREREQERRARMQLLDDIREPSPQPIFGEPVKVDLEDETSRRIKNTLGDFTQVLTNDPKNLIGISRSTGSGHQNGHQSNGYTSTGHPVNGYPISGHPTPGHMTYSSSAYSSNGHSTTGHPSIGIPSMGHTPFARPQAAFKKQHYVANGTSATKQSMPNYVAPKAPDKRINYNRSEKPGYNYKPESPAAPKAYHSSAGIQQPSYQSHDTRSRDPTSWENKDQRRANQPAFFNINVNVESNATINNLNVCNNNSISASAPIWNCGPDTPAIQINPFHLPSNATPSNPAKTMGYGQNTPQNTPYATNPIKTDSEKVTNTPPKRNQLRPSALKIQPEKKEAPIAVETILKEMTKAVPPAPLTAIQTPRTEETGFAFPAEPKEDTSFFKGIEQISLIQPFDDDLKPEPEPKDVSQHSSKPYVSSLQDDLEMSDSDEEAVPEVKSNPDQFLQSPVSDIATNSTTTITTTAPNPTVSTDSNTKMDANSAESSNSSSSESGDSDSDDSSSESNDSDSSSEASDEEISSKKWGLSNFVDESQRMHSPRFFQADAAAKGTLRLHSERMKSLALGNTNSMTATVKDPLPLPVTEQITTFLVPDVPVTTKSEILSPIPSPMHAAVGPRTPPSPSCAVNQDCHEINEDVQTVKSPEKTELSDTINPPIPNSPHSDAPLNNDLSEQKGYVQNEKCKKQLRSSTAKSEELNEHESSPPRDTFINENNAFKENSDISLEKESATPEIEKSTSSSVTSEIIEPSPENYSIKTRQRVSAASSAKKNKSSENSQKVDNENSPAIAKLKHPRACRKPNEKQVKKAGTNITSTKSDNVEQPKKRSKPETKEIKSSSERVSEPVKSSGNVKTVKSTRKSKTTKVPQKEIPEVKKSEPKKKKFAIENFVQSPEVSRPATASQVFSPSPERSPLPECEKNSSETVVQSSVSTTISSKAPCKTNLKSTEACKNVEKLRRSVRCSERASNNAQTEASSTPRASSENKKSSKNPSKTKCRVENLLSIEGVDRLELLSPIPMDPSVSTETPDSAIPMKIMVCIPFAKLSRLPSTVQPQESENIQGYRSRSASIDEGKSQKDSVSSDQSTKAVTAKRSLSKEVKDKKTVNPLKSSKSNIRNVSSIKKDKDAKSTSEASNKSKTASNVNKNSIKIKSKTYCDDTENTLPKKRKNEGKDQQIAKKKKVSSRMGEEKKLKESPSVVKSDSTVNVEEASKTKILERCDSTGSLSSLCSQQSQRSSKSSKEKKKDSSSGAPESKRIKTSTPVMIKDIKQEKEERPKVHIKKEPRTSSDKNKVKSRDKASVKDIPCAEKFSEQIWDDSLASSQCFRWDEQCNDDSKGKLVTNQSLDDADRALADWDHFAPDMHKVLKEASTLNKHNNQAPIMPMDYYYTEGRKQKQIAEKEKDPFQQAVKYFEAAVLFILTSQQKEEYTKDPQAIYQFYEKTLKCFGDIQTKVKGLQSCPGSTEFKLLILCLKCQSLLNVKLYNIKIKEIKEQMDGVTDFLHNYNTNAHNLAHQSRLSSNSSIPSPHSTIPSPASSVSTQTSGYGSNMGGSDMFCLRSNIPGYVNVPQTVLDMICRQHTHLLNLHRGHDNWEQADMYMTRSNLREFFKEVADQSEPLTLHSSITELVKYIQKGISLVKKSLR